MQTDWKEAIAPGEEQVFADYAGKITKIQARHSKKYGNGRALHRKQLLGLEGTLTLRADLPKELQHGLFVSPGKSYKTTIRLSNGAERIQRDGVPDIRGFAIKVHGVAGPSALGQGTTDAQDFLLIDRPYFVLKNVSEFMEIVDAIQESPASVLGLLRRKHGVVGMFKMLKKLGILPPKKFRSFATETFYTSAPIQWGPYAARLRLVPGKPHRKKKMTDWAADMRENLAEGPLRYELQAQFYQDEKHTPIEDHSVDWDSSYVTVGTLEIPSSQSVNQEAVEALRFDPWCALAEHRPLGNVMRARKHAYYASANARTTKQPV